ncbi:MAG: acetate uptake transporter [Polyangiaceae bacterium]
MGNNFGYSAFVSYGAFWIALCLMLLGNHFGVFKANTQDIGWFLVAWTLYTVIMFVGALRIHGAMAFTFFTLLIGFVLLDLGHFGYPVCNKIAGFELMICAFSAWYMMAGIILNELYGRPLLPMGKPWVSAKPATVTEAPVKVAA